MDPVGHPGHLGRGRARGSLVSSAPVLSWATTQEVKPGTEQHCQGSCLA